MNGQWDHMRVRLEMSVAFFVALAGGAAISWIVDRYTNAPAGAVPFIALFLFVYYPLARYLLRRSARRLNARAARRDATESK